MSEGSENTSQNEQILYDPHILTIEVFKNYRFSICKPLILLKITLFIYYGAGSFVGSFVTVLFKERGVSLAELSAMTMIAPFSQFIGTTLSGIITDRIGKSKPVFIVSVLITISAMLGFIHLPALNSTSMETQSIYITCNQSNKYGVKALTSCGTIEETIEVQSCHGYCLTEFTDRCLTEHIDCQSLTLSKEFNTSFVIYVNNTFSKRIKDWYQYNVSFIMLGNSTYSLCSTNQNKYCAVSCKVHSGVESVDSISWLLIIYGSLYVLFLTTYTITYRCLDITIMFLVKEYNSNFGHERFFGMIGHVLIPPLAGYIAHVTAAPGKDRNYCSALYLYMILCVVMIPFLYKLPMKVRPPGENVRQKSLKFLKRYDTWLFLMVLLVLGTAINLEHFLFWYLEELKASSFLMGLIISAWTLYGLPFLLTAHWWMKKIGASYIFLLAFLGHTINLTGYSIIQDPRFALLLGATYILTYFLLWVAVIEYSHDIAPDGLTATFIAMAGAIHFSIGKLPAGLIGIYIMHPYGGKIAFRFGAIMTFVAAILYGSYLCLKNKYLNEGYHLIKPGKDPPQPVSMGEDFPGACTNLSFIMESDGESEDGQRAIVKEEKEMHILIAAKSLLSRYVKVD